MTAPSILTVAQYNQLKTNIDAGDKVAFYLNLYSYSRSDAALLMAQISSSSGVVGGNAWSVNYQIQKMIPNRYPPHFKVKWGQG